MNRNTKIWGEKGREILQKLGGDKAPQPPSPGSAVPVIPSVKHFTTLTIWPTGKHFVWCL